MRRLEISGSNGELDFVLRAVLDPTGPPRCRRAGVTTSRDTAATKGLIPLSGRFCSSSKTLLQTCPEQVLGAEEAMLLPMAEACLHIGQWPCVIPGMPHEGAMAAMPSHRVMQSPPDICPTTSRSRSIGSVALRLTDLQSTPET
jgi:hypothetical protein